MASRTLLFVAVVSCAAIFRAGDAAPAPLRLGVVTSSSGALTDWNDTLKGYQFAVQQYALKNPRGIPVIDRTQQTYYIPLVLTALDDASSEAEHTRLVTQLAAAGGSDIILNGNPSFASSEAAITSTAGKINMHSVTTNSNVFGGALFGVFGIAPSSADYTTALFQAYRVANVRKVALVFRSDNEELLTACSEAKLNADHNLITHVDIPYTAASNLTAITAAINTSSVEALMVCGTSAEATTLYKQLHALRRPLKNIFFTNGPNRLAWNGQLQDLSTYLTAPALWASTLQGHSDTVFGTAQDFQVQYFNWAGSEGKDPSDYAAAGAAVVYTLWNALSTAFSDCDLSIAQDNATALLYNTSALSCSDNLNNGMRRLSRAMQLLSISTFFGSIGFNRQGMNYAGDVGIVQVFSATRDLKQVYAPYLVAPISVAVKGLVLPQPNRYVPVCPPGSRQNPDDYLPCIPCSPGQFQEKSGELFCEVAAKNTYSDSQGQTSATACPENTVTAERGSSSIKDCVCQVGFYNQQAQGGYPCYECPVNADCAGGTDWPRPQYGWYAEIHAPFTMYNCNPNLVCEGNYTCSAGYASRLCSYCDTENGYFMALSRCYKCPSNGLIILAMAFMVALFILLNTGITRQIDSFIVLVNFCQLLSLINMFNANWPNTISNLMNFASVLAFEPDCIQPQCLDKQWTFEDNLMFQLLMPLIILSFTLLWIGFTYTCYWVKGWLDGTGNRDTASVENSANSFNSGTSFSVSRVQSRSSDDGLFAHKGAAKTGPSGSSSWSSFGSVSKMAISSWAIVLQNMVHVPSNKAEMTELIYERLAIPLLFLNSSYMATLKICLSTFKCMDFAGTSYMYFMTKELCYSKKHYQLMYVAMAGIAVYCVGLWAMVIQVLHFLKKNRAFGDKVPLLLFGWMYDPFAIKYYWFEVVSMTHRTTMTILVVFLLEYTDIQLLVAFIITGTVLIVQVRTAAIADVKARTLDTIADALLLVVIVIGLMLNNPRLPVQTVDSLNNTLMAIIVGFLGSAGLIICIEGFFILYTSILMSRHNAIAKKWGHKIKRFKHMYKVFTPSFMIKWLTKAKANDWQEWHRLGLFLADYVHPTSETSYLSDRKVGRFWRYLLANFPEILDYLASVSDSQREHFNSFIETMYMDFFDTAEEHKYQLHNVVNECYRAPVAQWLAQASESEVDFLKNTLKHAYEHVEGKKAGMDVHRAMSRSCRSMNTRVAGATSLGAPLLLGANSTDDGSIRGREKGGYSAPSVTKVQKHATFERYSSCDGTQPDSLLDCQVLVGGTTPFATRSALKGSAAAAAQEQPSTSSFQSGTTPGSRYPSLVELQQMPSSPGPEGTESSAWLAGMDGARHGSRRFDRVEGVDTDADLVQPVKGTSDVRRESQGMQGVDARVSPAPAAASGAEPAAAVMTAGSLGMELGLGMQHRSVNRPPDSRPASRYSRPASNRASPAALAPAPAPATMEEALGNLVQEFKREPEISEVVSSDAPLGQMGGIDPLDALVQDLEAEPK